MRIYCSSILLLFTVQTSYLCCLNINGVYLRFFFGIVPAIFSVTAIAIANFYPYQANFYDYFLLIAGPFDCAFVIFLFYIISCRISNEKINNLIKITK
jgi:hypothetical protein